MLFIVGVGSCTVFGQTIPRNLVCSAAAVNGIFKIFLLLTNDAGI